MEASLGGLLAAPGDEDSAAEAAETERRRRKRIRLSISSQGTDPRLRLEAQTAINHQAKLKFSPRFLLCDFRFRFLLENPAQRHQNRHREIDPPRPRDFSYGQSKREH